MRFIRTTLAALAALVVVHARDAVAQDSTALTKTTMQGIFSDPQAERGKEIYLGQCVSCHTPESHTGPTFLGTWIGQKLVELYKYIVETMPKSDPGSLQPQAYVDALAYMLKLNAMPPGTDELPADTTVLGKIKIDTVKAAGASR
jgi:S-disulfanyl-L-cysteine oxidoreductase SoxD